MVLQKRLEYGFNGYKVPPTPRAPRSARKRASKSWKKNEDHNNNRMCAFDLLATVAGELLHEGDKPNQEENKAFKTEEKDCDQGSCNKSFFLSEIISKAPVSDSGPTSGITVSDFSQKAPSAPKSVEICKIEDINNKEMTNEVPTNGKPPLVNNLDSNVNLVIRDDDENSCGCTQNNKTFGPPSRIGDRRIRRLLASKQWKNCPKFNDDYRNKKSFYKHQRSLRDYPFKKRKLYQFDNPSNSNEDGSSLGPTSQDPAFQTQDSHVKLKIKSFRVPEFFIEIPETATVSSLKRTVMEAVTAIFSGELHVGVMLRGKRIRDDDKTLLQTGICHDNKLDALGFTLEPNKFQDRYVVSPPGTPKSLTRYSNEVVVIQHDDAPVTNSRNITETGGVGVDSRALVAVPASNSGGGLAVRKSKHAEVAQRRIRRPFSVSEVEALVEAVEKLGTGRWRDVKLRAFDDAKHRTYVDLKDKWKTLVHTARISPQQRRGEPVPQELLDRVLTAHGYWSYHQAKNQFKQTEICRLL
ncbi:telomere repeat-binding protein 5 isoform X1 [Lactuca sativa]|uniref:HTH myb-type domain-containing protein n=1 Tax=Lactuca sativa TaxID=4236 RepID=A0A9R1UTF9_LACSA|nr:telomere repeat-binding protein 5 isoform X1 [Lactuca sativa]XP_023732515.1 telomere repeat-binding protein 5 isoform X1 [Lactuca sativa]KAJ0192600.1 hypothetical protein LSAT_V11C800418390 [Lactuca sativa]